MATEYTILKRKVEGNAASVGADWQILKKVEAVSARAAVSAALNGEKDGGYFVAVPSRSWRPVKVEVQQALKFS